MSVVQFDKLVSHSSTT